MKSKARTEVLRALCALPNPLGIRHLARLTRLHPRSVELSLNSLAAEGILTRLPDAGRTTGVQINRQHPAFSRLRELFETDTLAELATRTPALDRRGLAMCAFMDDARTLIHRGRRSLHDVA